MLFFILTLAFSCVMLLMLGRSKSSFWFIGMLVGMGMLIIGVVFYLSKIGGIQKELEALFFLTPEIRNSFHYAPIGTNQLSIFTNIGRVSALFCFAGFCISESTLIPYQHKRWAYLGALVIAVGYFIVFYPASYSRLSGMMPPARLKNLDAFWRGTLAAVLAASSGLLIYNVVTMPLHWMRKRMAVVCASMLDLALVFVVMGIFTPLQISQMDRIYFFLSRFFYYSSASSMRFWKIIIATSITLTIISVFFLADYIRIERELGHPDGRFGKKVLRGDLGVRVFSHGIKNQILVNQVLISELLKLIQAEPEAAELTEKLLENNDGILVRINQLNDFFKEKKYVFQPLSVAALTAPVKEKYAHSNYGGKISFLPMLDDLVLVDKSLMQQTLVNIINNAVEAITNRENGSVEVSSYTSAHQVIIRIRDNGVGIPPHARNKIFEPFYTSKNSKNNWGIGLAYAQRILKEHGGSIRAESTGENGTSFYLVLPRYNREEKTYGKRK